MSAANDASSSSASITQFAHIALPIPLSRLFDYRIPDDLQQSIQIGARVKVPFGSSSRIGLVIKLSNESVHDNNKLKSIEALIDHESILETDIFQLCLRGSKYYHHPIGEVFFTAIPNALSKGKAADAADQPIWQLSHDGVETDIESLSKAPKQQALLARFKAAQKNIDKETLDDWMPNWRPSLNALMDKNLVCLSKTVSLEGIEFGKTLTLNTEQLLAVNAINESQGFNGFLLNGITGSGKTEVYLQAAEKVLKQDKQVLMLVPEIGLTPQLLSRFRERFKTPIVTLHSGMTDLERLKAWSLAKKGVAKLVIGTRSSLFSFLPNLGLILLDEEHDASFKQQDGFRYHARNLAMMLAQIKNIPIVMGSATPSLELLSLVAKKQITELNLTERAGNASPPRIAVIDARKKQHRYTLTESLITAINKHLDAGQQALLFLNRRGYAPNLHCASCGWHAQCQRCDAYYTLHQSPSQLRCHHCSSERPPPKQCPDCHYSHLETMGVGTEQLEDELSTLFPNHNILRIDRDSTKRKGALESSLDKVHSGEVDILLGTQMLAKGHHFPKVSLVGILDCDRGLFSSDFRGSEYMAQLILQVAGRAGREAFSGEVLIQSTQPDSQVLHTLIKDGYRQFSIDCMKQRKAALLPPYSHFALLRAEAVNAGKAMQFLSHLKQQLPNLEDVMLMGPIPSPMEKRAGRYRAQLLLQSSERKSLHHVLSQLRHYAENTKTNRQVRWHLDIDPMDMF